MKEERKGYPIFPRWAISIFGFGIGFAVKFILVSPPSFAPYALIAGCCFGLWPDIFSPIFDKIRGVFKSVKTK